MVPLLWETVGSFSYNWRCNYHVTHHLCLWTFIPEKKKLMFTGKKKKLYTDVRSSFLHKHQNLEKGRWLSQRWYVYGITQQWNSTTRSTRSTYNTNNLSESPDGYAEWKKLLCKCYILYGSIDINCLNGRTLETEALGGAGFSCKNQHKGNSWFWNCSDGSSGYLNLHVIQVGST